MKLHLPTRLRSAVIACITAVAAVASTVGTGVLATGAIAYTMAASQAMGTETLTENLSNPGGKIYADGLDVSTYTITSNYPSSGYTTIYANGLAGSGNITYARTNSGGNNCCVLWLDGDATNYTGAINVNSSSGNTVLKFGSANGALQLTQSDVTVQGKTVFAVGSDVTVKSLTLASGVTLRTTSDSAERSTTLQSSPIQYTGSSTGAGVAGFDVSGDVRTITVTSALQVTDGSFSNGVNFAVSSGCNANFNGATFGDNGTITNAGALTLGGNIKLTSAIVNNGTVTLGNDLKFDLSALTATDGVYQLFTGNAVTGLSALTKDNILNAQAGYEYTFNDNGTVTAVLTSHELAWEGGAMTWDEGTAMVGGNFTDGDIVTFRKANADVTLGTSLTAASLTVESGIEVSISGSGKTLTAPEMVVNGTLALDHVALAADTITVAGKLSLDGGSLATGALVTNSGNSAEIAFGGTQTVVNQLTGFTGTVRVLEGGVLKMAGTTTGNNTKDLGAWANTIIVEKGGVLDSNGRPDFQYAVTLNGGSLVNTGAAVGSGKRQFNGLTLTDDSLIGGTAELGVIAGSYGKTQVALGSHTLAKTGSNTFHFYNSDIRNGTLRVESGTLNMQNNTNVQGVTLEMAGGIVGGTLVINDDMTIKGVGAGTVSAAVSASGHALTMEVADSAELTISGAVTAASLNKTGAGLLVLDAANTLSGGVTVTAGSLEAYEGDCLGAGNVQVASGGTLLLADGALAAGGTVTNSGTVELAQALTRGTINNQGTLTIATGYWDMEDSGFADVDGSTSTDGNGFSTGLSITVTDGATLTGKQKLLYGGNEYDVVEGKVSVSEDWTRYVMNTQTTFKFSEIKAKAEEKGATLTAIEMNGEDLKLDVDANGMATSMITGFGAYGEATLTMSSGVELVVDAEFMPTITAATDDAEIVLNMKVAGIASSITGGNALTVKGSATGSSLNLGSDSMNRTLTVQDTLVISSHGGNATGFNTGATNIKAGGTLRLTGGDAMGWGDSAAGKITLLGEDGNLATLELADRNTLKTDLEMQGNALIKAVNADDHSTAMLDPYGGSLTVSGKNNVITCGLRQRSAYTITVAEDSELTFDGTVLTNTGTDGTITKDGEGSINFKGVTGNMYGFGHANGESTFDGSTVTVLSHSLDLSKGGASTGMMKLVNGTSMRVGSSASIWMSNNATLEVDETSTLVIQRSGYDMSISAADADTHAVIAGTGSNVMYNLDDTVTISNAVVTMESASAQTLNTALGEKSTLVNAGAGALTLQNAGNATLGAVKAQSGDITLTTTTSIGTVDIAAGKQLLATAEGPLTITTALTAGAGSLLDTALVLGENAALNLTTGDSAMSLNNKAVTLGTGITLSQTMITAIEALEAEQSLTLISNVSELTNGAVSAESVFGNLTGDYTVKVEEGNLVISAAALPMPELAWLGGNGTWGGETTPWTAEGQQVAYQENAIVTIGGESAPGGTITVDGSQTATSVTVASSGYTLAAATGGSLSITGDLTVNEGKTFTLGFLPTVGGSMVVNKDAVLDATAISIGNETGTFNSLLSKTTGEGTLKLQEPANKAVVLTENAEVKVAKLDVTGQLELNSWKTPGLGLTLGEGKTMTVHGGALIVESTAIMNVAGGTLDAQGGITLGHAEANHPGTLNMSAGEVKTTGFTLRDNGTQNVVNVTGGTLTITGASAFSQTTTGTTVGISGATLTNVDQDMSFNHSSTLTNATVDAKGDKTITLGAEGTTTTLAGTLTTKGKVTLDGTLASTGLTGVVNSGTLVSNSDLTVKGLNNTGTLAVTGTLTVADATTTGGETSATNVSVADNTTFSKLTVSGTATVTDGKVLTVGNQSTIGTLAGKALTVSGGTVTIQSATTLSTLANSGTLNVSGALTLTGAVTNGGTIAADSLVLSDDGKLTATALTTASVSFGVIEKNAPLTLGTLTAKSGSVDFVVTEDDLKAMANGSHVTLTTLENAYGSTLVLNGNGTETTIGDFKYTLAASEDKKTITLSAVTTTEGWKGGEGQTWNGTSAPWGEGDPATSTAKFLGNGTSAVVIEGTQSAKDVLVSTMLDGTKTQSYTFSGDALEIEEDINVNNGALVIDNETSVGGNVVVTESDEAAKSSIAVGADGVLDITGNLTFTGADATVDNQGGMVIGGTADFTMTGGGDLATGMDAAVTLHGDTTVDTLTNGGTLKLKDGALTVTTLSNSGTLDLGSNDFTVEGDNASIGTFIAGNLTVSGGGNTATAITADTLTLGAVGNTVGDMTVSNLVFESLDGVTATEAAMNLTGSNLSAKVTVDFTDEVLSMLTDTTAGDTYKLISGTLTADAFEMNSHAAQSLYMAGKTFSFETGSLILKLADTEVTTAYWNVGEEKAGNGLDIADSTGKITNPEGLATIQNVNVIGTKTIDLTDDTYTDLMLRNLTGNQGSSLAIKGDGDDTVSLNVNPNKEVFAGNGTLDQLTLDNVQATVLSEDGETVLEIESVSLTRGAGLDSVDGALSVGSLNAAGQGAGTISGQLAVTGTGGKYLGSYGEGTEVTLGTGAEQTLAVGSGLTVVGSGALTLVKPTGAMAMDALQMNGGSVNLGDMTDTTLTLAQRSAVRNGSVHMTVDSAKVGSGDTGAVVAAPGLDLAGSTLVIGQSDDATVLDIDTGKKQFVLATLPGSTAGTQVVVEGPGMHKYFSTGTVTGDGLVVVTRNTSYFSGLIAPQSGNAAAGAGMLDDALLEKNPQATNPTGDLAQVMDALEGGALRGAAKETVAAAMAGASAAAMGVAFNSDVDRQLRAIRNRTTTMGLAECDRHEGLPYFNAWVNAEGDFNKLGADGTLAGYKMSSWGATLGVDVDFTNRLTAGLAVTAMQGDFTANSAEQATGDLDRIYVSAFARYAHRAWTHTFVATLGKADTSLERTVNYGTGSYTTKGDSDGTAFGLMYEAGYTKALDEDGSTCLQPLFNISYRHSSLGGYTETGSDAALRVGSADMDTVSFGLGARLQSVVGTSVYNRASLFECRALLRLDAGDRDAAVKSNFTGLAGDHSVKSAEVGAFGLELGAGLTLPMSVDAGNIFMDVSMDLRSGYSSVNGTVGYRINF